MLNMRNMVRQFKVVTNISTLIFNNGNSLDIKPKI